MDTSSPCGPLVEETTSYSIETKKKKNLSFHIFNRTKKEMFSRMFELFYCIQYNLMVCVFLCVLLGLGGH